MRVAVFRASDDAARTAAKLRSLGHEPLLAPVIVVEATGAAIPTGDFDGVIFTSAHGAAALAHEARPELRRIPCFCVGERTAEVARAAAFRDVHIGRADAERLAETVRTALPAPSRLLLVTGRDRKGVIEQRLGAAGHSVDVMEAYEARAVDRWPANVAAAFAAGRIAAALHYSRRSADLALRCASAGGISREMRATCHVCLSDDVAIPLRRDGAERVAVALEPNETSLLTALALACLQE